MQSFIQALATIELGDDAVRLFHGRGGHYVGCEHLCLDWFAPVLLLTSFTPLADDDLATCQQAIAARWQAIRPDSQLNLVYQYRSAGRPLLKCCKAKCLSRILLVKMAHAFRCI